mmetsp:Transcript_1881/g.5476  ORF Transcript_1881/g.5476 Transcript_1881/m.5476 type:complete len:270 (+) Transcript_1881:1922-2731(+)
MRAIFRSVLMVAVASSHEAKRWAWLHGGWHRVVTRLRCASVSVGRTCRRPGGRRDARSDSTSARISTTTKSSSAGPANSGRTMPTASSWAGAPTTASTILAVSVPPTLCMTSTPRSATTRADFPARSGIRSSLASSALPLPLPPLVGLGAASGELNGVWGIACTTSAAALSATFFASWDTFAPAVWATATAPLATSFAASLSEAAASDGGAPLPPPAALAMLPDVFSAHGRHRRAAGFFLSCDLANDALGRSCEQSQHVGMVEGGRCGC